MGSQLFPKDIKLSTQSDEFSNLVNFDNALTIDNNLCILIVIWGQNTC